MNFKASLSVISICVVHDEWSFVFINIQLVSQYIQPINIERGSDGVKLFTKMLLEIRSFSYNTERCQ